MKEYGINCENNLALKKLPESTARIVCVQGVLWAQSVGSIEEPNTESTTTYDMFGDAV